jgi:hypothetical protein
MKSIRIVSLALGVACLSVAAVAAAGRVQSLSGAEMAGKDGGKATDLELAGKDGGKAIELAGKDGGKVDDLELAGKDGGKAIELAGKDGGK